MSADPAETLATDLIAGNYVPANLDDCVGHLPVDRSPQVVRLQQFVLFAQPEADIRSPNEPAYLIFQQYNNTGTPPVGVVNGIVGPLAGALTDIAKLQQSTTRAGLTPSLGPTGPARPVRRTAATTANPTPDGLAGVLGVLRRAGFSPGSAVSASGTPGILIGVLTPVVIPTPYQPFRDPHPHIALFATFEQVWDPKGYTRGELINTIGLAPGEDLTLEFHSWDKTTYKSVDDLVQESELKISQTATQRDSLTVARENTTQTGGRLNIGATIPIEGATVTLGGDASMQISNSVKQTAEQSQQRTVDAANTLKTARKVNIEISRDTGREDKQTRRIVNTNRCHSLSCHYFEVMANYLVQVRLASLQPCLLLPTPRANVTSAWVLCHEATLKSAILDNAYLPGFDGAQTLEDQDAFVEIRKIRGTIPGGFEAELKLLRADILDTFGQLVAIGDLLLWPLWLSAAGLATAGASGSLGTAIYTAASAANFHAAAQSPPVDGSIVLRRLLYFVLLAANERLLHALRRFKKNGNAQPPSLTLRLFFASVAPHEYQLSVSATAIVKGLAALGLPTTLFDSLTSWNLADLVPDDSGLYDALSAAAKRLDEIWSLPSQSGPSATSEGFADIDIAEARVNFQQLRCHIEDNWLHYAKAMWLDEDPDARFLRLQNYGAVAAVLGTDVLGFLGHKQAFAVTKPEQINPPIFADLISQVTADFDKNAPAPRLIALPTGGTILESIVGQCDGCEDFIQQSRLIDLRSQDAKAQQEEAEAKRRQLRLAATPPDLSAPDATAGQNVTVNVGGTAP
jgi:hypothetical protein